MKLTEFLNDDTCQILLAIIVGIVICYFIFGSCSTGCSRRDGFSVGGQCTPQEINDIERACCGNRACTENDLNTCSEECANVYLPLHDKCMTGTDDSEITRQYQKLKQSCELNECMKIQQKCGTNISCFGDCSDTFYKYKDNCQDYINSSMTGRQAADAEDYLRRVNIACIESRHDTNLAEYQQNISENISEDLAQIETNNKNILRLYFRHIIDSLDDRDQKTRYLNYLDNQNTDGGFSSRNRVTNDEIGRAIGLNFLKLSNEADSRQNFPEFNSITSGLVEGNQTNNQYLTDTVVEIILHHSVI